MPVKLLKLFMETTIGWIVLTWSCDCFIVGCKQANLDSLWRCEQRISHFQAGPPVADSIIRAYTNIIDHQEMKNF